MACGSGCCEPPQNGEQAASPPNTARPTTANEVNDADSCGASDSKSDGGCKDSCCGDGDASGAVEEPIPAPAGCQSGCCGGQKEEVATTSKADSQAHHDNGRGCDSPAAAEHGTKPEDPECCDGTTVPCCDDSCLDRLALRACEGEKKPHPVVKESPSGMLAHH